MWLLAQCCAAATRPAPCRQDKVAYVSQISDLRSQISDLSAQPAAPVFVDLLLIVLAGTLRQQFQQYEVRADCGILDLQQLLPVVQIKLQRCDKPHQICLKWTPQAADCPHVSLCSTGLLTQPGHTSGPEHQLA